jgi:hypothetical protein
MILREVKETFTTAFTRGEAIISLRPEVVWHLLDVVVLSYLFVLEFSITSQLLEPQIGCRIIK